MANQWVKEATDNNFENDVLNADKPALVDFWAVWCGPCKALAPVIDELAEENKDKLNVFKLNVDDNPNMAAKFGVRGIPTVMLFKDGKLVDQHVGVAPKADLQSKINAL